MGQVLEVGRLIGHDPRTPRGLGLQAETHGHMNNKTEEGSRGNSSLRGGHGCVVTDEEMLTGGDGAGEHPQQRKQDKQSQKGTKVYGIWGGG